MIRQKHIQRDKNTLTVISRRGVHQKEVGAIPEAGSLIREEGKLMLHTSDGYYLICHADILYCQAESNYCLIHCADGRKILVSKPLKWIALQLAGDAFERIHQSVLVRTEAIWRIARHEVELKSGQLLPVARSQRSRLVQHLQKKYAGAFLPEA